MDQHACADSAQLALRDFRSRAPTGVCVTLGSTKHVETGEDAHGRRESSDLRTRVTPGKKFQAWCSDMEGKWGYAYGRNGPDLGGNAL